MKHRLFYANGALASNKDRSQPLNAGNVQGRQDYYLYGNIVPSNITGSKSYCTKQWLDLVARVSVHGPGDIFFTLTFNESWGPLKEILSQYENSARIFHPVDAAVYFFERFPAVKELILGKKGAFGGVLLYWYRIEWL